MPKVPIILVGKDVWRPFDRYVRTILDERLHTIKPIDADMYKILDDVDDIVECVNDYENRGLLNESIYL
jgi:predicted Rossmann-fold nucleotide-binding protein